MPSSPDPRLARFAWIEQGTASGLAAGCAAPHALGRPRDAKGPTDPVLPEILRVFTELRRVDYGSARAGFELGFAPRSSAGARWVASCGDVRTCEILAGLYRRIDPHGGVQLHCGAPPDFAASGSRSDLGAAVPLGELRTQPAACARIRACQLGLDLSPLTVCEPMPEAPLVRCARREACGEVSECAKAFERDWERKHPPPALPQPRKPPPGLDELPEGVGY